MTKRLIIDDAKVIRFEVAEECSSNFKIIYSIIHGMNQEIRGILKARTSKIFQQNFSSYELFNAISGTTRINQV
jgi:hypothetical protein